ncbi:MAG: hypothetical protein AB9835_00605 [Eubacteriales bacterium]
MNSNRKKIEPNTSQSRAGEVVINRLLLMFMLSVVGVVALLYMGRMSISQVLWLYQSQLPLIVLIITGLLFVGSFILFLKNKGRLAEERKKTINSLNLLCSSAFVFLFALYLKFPGNVSYPTVASNMLIVLVATTVLYFIYHLYQREFFILSLLTALSAVGIYYSGNMLVKIALIAYAALILVLTLVLRSKSGAVKLGKRKIKLIESGIVLPFVLLALLVITVAVLTFILTGISVYGLIALFAYYLIMGIFFTVKLM